MFVDQVLFDIALRGLLLSVFAIIWIVLLVRIVGLRSFSKMTNFDFVVTVATGSLLAGATQSTSWHSFAQTMLGIAALFFVQWLTARLRQASDLFETIVQNNPVVLMRDGRFIDEALRETRVGKDDLVAKLREANVLSLKQVRAVVLETTGDISVLHGDQLDDALLAGVRTV